LVFPFGPKHRGGRFEDEDEDDYEQELGAALDTSRRPE
jgi:hypothetical protein